MTAPPLPRRRLGRAARDGDGRARAAAASSSTAEPACDAVGDSSLVPDVDAPAAPPELPELSEPEVLRHYLHLSQETLGMMGISLFGTCTMKYNPRLGEALAARPELAELHPYQDDDTLQGVLAARPRARRDPARAVRHGRVRVPGRRRRARRRTRSPCVARAYHAARGELEQRDEVITTIQAHPCNAATAAAAGFKVVTLMLGHERLPVVDALRPPSPTARRR